MNVARAAALIPASTALNHSALLLWYSDRGASMLPPAPRLLYRHAIEGFLGFLSLRELDHAAVCCRSWRAAAESMQSLHVDMSIRSDLMTETAVLPPRRARDVSSLTPAKQNSDMTIKPGALADLSVRFTKLRVLECRLWFPSGAAPGSPPAPIVFPPSLRELRVSAAVYWNAAEREAILHGVCKLTRLETLDLALRIEIDEPWLLTQLPLLTSLTSLRIQLSRDSMEAQLTEDEIRMLRSLHTLCSLTVDGIQHEDLTALLQPPHDLHWERCSVPFGVDEAFAATFLSPLTMLTSLQICFDGTDLCWLASLPSVLQLRHLDLSFFKPMSPASIASLRSCSHLTHLRLAKSASIDCACLSSVLQVMCDLRRLHLCEIRPRLTSLAFLRLPNLVESLAELEMEGCKAMHPAELAHAIGCHSLRRIVISSAGQTISSADRAAIVAAMPQLTPLTYCTGALAR